MSTFLDSSNKVIRKIDCLDKKVEKSFTEMLLQIIEINQQEEFMKD